MKHLWVKTVNPLTLTSKLLRFPKIFKATSNKVLVAMANLLRIVKNMINTWKRSQIQERNLDRQIVI